MWWWHQRPELSLREVIFMGDVECCGGCPRVESLRREVAVLRAEREALLVRLESARKELLT